jgi:hypothetical protein
MLVEGLQQAPAQRHRRVGRPVEGPHLEAAAVVQLEELGGEQAHRMHLQVAAEVADPDLAFAPARGPQRPGRRPGHLVGHEAHRGQQLQRRVVRQPHHRQQRGAGEELVGRDLAHRRVGRPGALLLAHVHVVLHHVGLGRLELEAGAHQRLGLGQPLAGFEQARAVVQRVQAVLDGRRGAVDDLAPDGHGAGRVAAALAQMAQVEQRRREARRVRQRAAVGGLGAPFLSGLRQNGAPVEAGHVQQRVRMPRVARDPLLVQRGGRLGLAAREQRAGLLQQLVQRRSNDGGCDVHGQALHPRAESRAS